MLVEGIKKRDLRQKTVIGCLILITLILASGMLALGQTLYPPWQVFEALFTGLSHSDYFTLVVLRLPRMLAAVLSGMAFGMAGSAFQTLLRNPLASPDMIGINVGASAAAVFGILVLKWSGVLLSTLAVGVGLLTALLIYALAEGGQPALGRQFSHGRLILIGISVQAALGGVISTLLLNASQYDVQGAVRWLSGSLHSIQLKAVWPLAAAVLVAGSALIYLVRHLNILALGDEVATALGLRVGSIRLMIIICAVILTAFASALTGPIAFVAFLSGPIGRALGSRGEGNPLIAGLVGAIIVTGGDLMGQQVMSTKLPVGIITGLVGAPYLIFCLVQAQRKGGI